MRNIEIEKMDITRGVQFTSYIAINRHLDRDILKDSELLCLLIYIALKVKRSNKQESIGLDNIKLEVGQVVMGRLRAKNDIGITDSKYRTKLQKLLDLKIIEPVKITNKYSIYKWLENSFIDVNLEIPNIQQVSQQTASGISTNNNINNTNKYSSLISIISFVFPKISIQVRDSYLNILISYMKYKGVEIRGEEVKQVLFIIKKMLDSDRTEKQIIDFMKWMRENDDNEEVPWVRFWTINTVQSKLHEFIADKLDVNSWEDEFPEI